MHVHKASTGNVCNPIIGSKCLSLRIRIDFTIIRPLRYGPFTGGDAHAPLAETVPGLAAGLRPGRDPARFSGVRRPRPDLHRRLRGGDPAGRPDGPRHRAAGGPGRRGDRRPAQRHLRQRRRADHRPDGPPPGALRRGQGLAHRLHHRQHPAGAGRLVRGRRPALQDPAVQSGRRAQPVHDAHPGRHRPGGPGRLPPPGRQGGPAARGGPEPGDLHHPAHHLRAGPALLAAHPPPPVLRPPTRPEGKKHAHEWSPPRRSSCWPSPRS